MVDRPPHLMTNSLGLSSLTVNDFLAQINWSGEPRLTTDPALATIESGYKTVGQFFETFPWQGDGALPDNTFDLELTMEAETLDDGGLDDDDGLDNEDVFTLEDLSALF